MQLTPEQIHSILSLREYPSVSYAGITCHKSSNVQVTVSSTVDADQGEVEGLIIGIFPLAQYSGKPHVSKYDNLTSELFGIATGIHGVTVDLHMVKTKKKVERIEEESMRSIRI